MLMVLLHMVLMLISGGNVMSCIICLLPEYLYVVFAIRIYLYMLVNYYKLPINIVTKLKFFGVNGAKTQSNIYLMSTFYFSLLETRGSNSKVTHNILLSECCV